MHEGHRRGRAPRSLLSLQAARALPLLVGSWPAQAGRRSRV